MTAENKTRYEDSARRASAAHSMTTFGTALLGVLLAAYVFASLGDSLDKGRQPSISGG